MKSATTMAIYENGTLRLKRRLPFRNHEQIIVRILRKPDSIEGTRGVIQVSRSFARELLRPHRASLLDR